VLPLELLCSLITNYLGTYQAWAQVTCLVFRLWLLLQKCVNLDRSYVLTFIQLLYLFVKCVLTDCRVIIISSQFESGLLCCCQSAFIFLREKERVFMFSMSNWLNYSVSVFCRRWKVVPTITKTSRVGLTVFLSLSLVQWAMARL
jgi:hypothetical protein